MPVDVVIPTRYRLWVKQRLAVVITCRPTASSRRAATSDSSGRRCARGGGGPDAHPSAGTRPPGAVHDANDPARIPGSGAAVTREDAAALPPSDRPTGGATR